jgi:hypothetical protein
LSALAGARFGVRHAPDANDKADFAIAVIVSDMQAGA